VEKDAIQVEGLIVEYKQAFRQPFRAVDGLSFRVAPGEVVGFIGVNGAGKSSTIKALMGFQSVAGGAAKLFGLDAGAVEARRRIGFLPETAIYSPYLTPTETLRLYGNLHGLSGASLKERIAEVLDRVGAAHKARCMNRSLSKGMLQRVGIAQALLASPDLLILDEVSSGLDPIGRRDLRQILLAERNRGATIFFSSHELHEVEELCDRVVVIHAGRLVADRSVADLVQQVGNLEEYFVNLVKPNEVVEKQAA
jgi:ABC-2 type transport system ATP-binding protein